MTVLARAPMLAVLGALVVCLAFFDRTGLPEVLFLSPLFVLSFAFLTYKQEVRGQWPVLTVTLVIALSLALRIFCVLRQPAEGPRSIQVEGKVSLVRPWGRRHYAAVLNTPEGGFLMRLHFATLVEGMRLRVEGITRPLRPADWAGGFDEERYWRARGVVSWLSPSNIEPLPSAWSLPRLRHAVSRALVIYMPPLTGAYLRAAWTGQRDEELYKSHRAWGTSHLLAVSGFHVSIFLLLISFLLGRRRVLPLSALLWGYVLLTGAAPSALRAGLMIQAALLGQLLGRPSSPVNSVCLAAALLLFHSPFLFWDMGWRLSVLAALTLTAVYSTGGRRLRTWLLVSPAISLVTFPQVAYAFGGFPVVGLLLNLVAPFIFSAALTVASIAALLRLVGFPFMPLLLSCAEGGFKLCGWGAEWLRLLMPWTIPWLPLAAWMGAGVLFFLLCCFLQLPAGRTAALTVAGAAASFLLFL